MGNIDPRGYLTGNDVIYVYPDYQTLLVGKFENSVMVSAHSALAIDIKFDEVSGIPMIIPGEVNCMEDTFSYDESDTTSISRSPLLQGKTIKIYCFYLQTNLNVSYSCYVFQPVKKSCAPSAG